MIFAQIKNGVVKNIIVLHEESDLEPHQVDFDFCKNIDEIFDLEGNRVFVGKNWQYADPDVWSPPEIIPDDFQKIYENKIQKAIEGFEALMITYVAENIILGITQQGKTKLIADTLIDVQRYGQSGSLYQVIATLQAIVITPDMAPFITEEKLEIMTQNILELLSSL